MASEEEFSDSTQAEKKKKDKQKKGKRSKAMSLAAEVSKEYGKESPTDSDIQRCNETFWKRSSEEEAVAYYENSFM
ncbi:hypothetical protein ACS0TY_016635 [Phlomoides rotata]